MLNLVKSTVLKSVTINAKFNVIKRKFLMSRQVATKQQMWQTRKEHMLSVFTILTMNANQLNSTISNMFKGPILRAVVGKNWTTKAQKWKILDSGRQWPLYTSCRISPTV